MLPWKITDNGGRPSASVQLGRLNVPSLVSELSLLSMTLAASPVTNFLQA